MTETVDMYRYKALLENMFILKFELVPKQGFNPTETDAYIMALSMHLDMECDILMNKLKQVEFSQTFKKLCNRIFNKKDCDSSSRNYSIHTINTKLEALSLPYLLLSDGGEYWILVKK